MTDRAALRCDQCGQVDDHPKVHIGEVTKHHDCLSYQEREMVMGSNESTPGAAAQIVEACEGGKRGAELLAFIEQVHVDEVK